MSILNVRDYEGVPQSRHLSKVDAEEYGVLKTELESQEKNVKELKEGGLPLIITGLGFTAIFILAGLGLGFGLGYASGSLGFPLGLSIGLFGGTGLFLGSILTIGGVLNMVEYFKAKKELEQGITDDRLEEMITANEREAKQLEQSNETLRQQIAENETQMKDLRGGTHQLEHILMQNGFREVQIEGNQ